MSNKTSSEIIFGLIVEELNPPALKPPAPLQPAVIVRTKAAGLSPFMGGEVSRRAIPLRQFTATFTLPEEQMQTYLDKDEIQRLINSQLVQRLVQDLMQVIEVREEKDYADFSRRFSVTLYFALPSDMQQEKRWERTEFEQEYLMKPTPYAT